MPINYPQFRRLNAAETGGFGGVDLAGSLRSGLQNANAIQEARFKPQQMQEQIRSQELANKINEAKAQYAPEQELANLKYKQAGIGHLGAQTRNIEAEMGLLPYRQKLIQAQTSRAEQLANQPYGGNLTGIAQEALGIAQLTGQDPKEVAQKLYQNKLQQADALNDYRKSLIQMAPKKASTQLAKLQQEEQEVQQGFLPGSNGQVRLNKDQQQSLSGQYKLARQKLSSDVDTRKKLLYATNLDKTLDNINVDDLTQYSGIAGGLEKKIAEGKSLSGGEEKKYEAYQKSLTATKLLAKQVRQFYGDSITPSIQEKLGELTNPASWKLNPKVAKQNFNQFKSIVHQETQTYRDALQGNDVYRNAPKGNNNSVHETKELNGKTYMKVDGEWYELL
jgi:hypothetical protein